MDLPLDIFYHTDHPQGESLLFYNKIFVIHEIWGSHSSEYKDVGYLSCDSV